MSNILSRDLKQLEFAIKLELDVKLKHGADGEMLREDDGTPITEEVPTFSIPDGPNARLPTGVIEEIKENVRDTHGMDESRLYAQLDREARLGTVTVTDETVEYSPRDWVVRKL